ncbi:MAG: hypothetical protein HQL96_17175 [Magnetococcales bacterium]|nr:hypothetical protein [Magnetococcales bacterium]
MRLLILLLLGAVTALALFYGLRLLWRTIHPQAAENVENAPSHEPPAWMTGRNGLILLLLMVLGILGVILHDFLATEDPQEHRPPPPLTPKASPRS